MSELVDFLMRADRGVMPAREWTVDHTDARHYPRIVNRQPRPVPDGVVRIDLRQDCDRFTIGQLCMAERYASTHPGEHDLLVLDPRILTMADRALDDLYRHLCRRPDIVDTDREAASEYTGDR